MKRKRRNIGDRVQLIVDEVLYFFGHTSPSSADAARGRSLQLTRLEERVLMSASPMAVIAEVAMVAVESSPVAATYAGTNTAASTENTESSDHDEQPPSDTANAEAASEHSENRGDTADAVDGIELIVIDSRVQDADTLLASLFETDRDFRLLRLDANTDGFRQITEKLEQIGNVSAVHLLTHGRDGEILLGSTQLNADTLAQHAPEFLAWQHGLTANADLLLYGCDVAGSIEGQDFVESLSQLTGADVAASTNATGSSNFGGDWDLEYQIGAIETQVFGSSVISGDWNDLLGIITVSTTNDVLDGDTSSVAALLASKGMDGFISLREAMIATNNTVGADTIFLTAGTFTFSIGGQAENAAFTGDLDITDSLTITGAGSGLSIIDANALDRVFELRGAVSVMIEDVTIRGGLMSSSNWGGGVLTDNGSTLNLSRVVVTGNSTGSGAGIYNYGTLVATDTIISNNTASDWGGGLYNDRGNVTLNRVTISGNAAGKDGGGIENAGSGASLSLTNVTLSGNIATGSGGGLWTSENLTATNVTVAFNDAASGDGIFMQGGGAEVFLRNSVLYNTSGANANRAVTSLGNNIDSDGTAGLTGPSDQSNINPLLDATLQNNGGFVTTHRLLSGSSAIDTGSTVSAPTVDARNTARDSAPDLGAFEVQGQLTGTSESLVNTATTNTQSTSSESRGSTHAVAAARDGSHVVVWSSLNQDGGGWGVYGQRFDAVGNKVGVEFLINQTTTNDQKYATVAMNGRGDFVVSWTSVSQDGSGNGVYARRYNAAGTALGNEFRVNATTTLDQDSPVVAMAGDGRFLIVWEGQGTGDASGIFGRWYAANGAASGSEVLINTTTSGVQGDPSVAMAPDGRAVVVWSDSNGVWAQRFDASGTAAGTEIHVENNGSAGAPDVEMAADGSFVVAYRQTVFDVGVYFRRFDAGGTPLGMSAEIANSATLGNQTDPSMAMDDTGNFLIVWQGNGTGDGNGVFGRLFTASGTALNYFEFRINETTTGTQSMASAAMLAGGNFVVAWSGVAAADSTGIYSRLFDNTPPTITAIANQTIPENGATAALGFTIGDAESSTLTLVVTASSSNSALVSPGGLVLAGFGANRTIRVTPNANQTGTTTITVTVDDNSTTTSSTFLLTVTQVNNVPVITSNGGGPSATISVAENVTAVSTVTATDADLPAQTLTYSILGGADAAKFAINGTTGVLTFVAAPNYESPTDVGANNVYDVTVQVSDGSLTDTQAISVTVTNSTTGDILLATQDTYINSVSPTLNYGQATNLVVDKSTGGIGAGRALLLFDLADIPANVTITSATLVMQATQNSGPFDINVYQVTQAWQEGSGNGTAGAANWTQRQAGVNWTATGGAYANTVIATLNTGATGQHTWDVTSLVADWYAGNKVNYGVILGSPNLGTGTVTYDSAEGARAPQLLVTFDATNGPPIITSNGGGAAATVSIAENATVVTTVAATDVNLPAQTLTYSISGGADAAKFLINSSTGVLTFASAPNFETQTDAGADNTYDVIVQVSDGIATDDQAIAVTITPVNDNNPVITSNGGGAVASINVAENTTVVATVAASDADLPVQTLTYSISGGPDASKFAINSTTGALTFVSARNFESPADVGANNVYDVIVLVSDGTLTDTQAIAVTVTAVNDNTPVITSNGGGVNATISVAENTTAVTTVTATDADLPAQTLTYSISGGADASKFAINSTTGALTFVSARNFESPADVGANNIYDVIVLVSDGTLSDTQAIAVTVTAVNDNTPVITSNGGGGNATINVGENTTAVTTVTATDSDLPAQTLTYSISGGADASMFAIDSTTGVLSFLTTPDFETRLDAGANNTYDVTVQVTDGTLTDTQEIGVSVTNVNEAPTSVALSGTTVTGYTNGAAVGTVTVTDPDANDTAIVTVSDNRFEVTNGILRLKSTSSIDPLSQPNVTLTLTATDAGGPSISQSFTLTVTNPNTPSTLTLVPVFSSLSENTNTGASIKVASIVVNNDGFGTDTLTLTGTDAEKFRIVGSDLYLKSGTILDFETQASLQVTVNVDDATLGSSPDDSKNYTLTITDVNEAPTANAGGPYAISEGDALTVAAGPSVDPEGLPLTYAWDIDGDGLFTDASGSTATLTWSQLNSLSSPINDNGTRALAVRVTDAGGISTVATTGLTVTNTAPTVSVTGNATTSSGMPYVISFATADPGTDTITMYRVNWGDGTTEDISGTAASATHTYRVPGGTRSITATATDEDGTFPMNGGPLVVTVLNTAPSAPTLSDSVVPGLKNGAVVGTLNFTDQDSGDSHTWTVSDNRFKVEGSILKLKSSKQLNPVTEPTVTLTVTVTDANGASGTSVFTLRVNNPPVSTSDAYLVDGTQQLSISSPSLGVLANDIDAESDPFTANLVSGPSHAATFGLNADGTFWYRAAAGYSGIDTFRYRVTDGENTGAVTTVTLTVNQPATLTYTALISAVPEHQTLSSPLQVGTFTIVDDGFGTNTLTLSGTDAALFALDNDNNLFLKAGLTVDFAVKTRFEVTALVDDIAIAGTPDSSRAQVISVQNINDAPTASALPNVVILEDAPAGTISAATVFFDKDGDPLSYTVHVVSQTPGLIKTLSINQTTGVISYSLHQNAFGSAILRVTGKDPSNATASTQFQLIVQPINDAPVAQGYSGSTFSGQVLTSTAPGVLSSVTDSDLNPLAVTLVSGTANGTVMLQANGSFVYTPNVGFQGTDTFSFVASDGILLSNIGTATISVRPPFVGQPSGSSSSSSGFGTPVSTTANGTTGSTSIGSTSTGSGTAGSPETSGSGPTNSASSTGSGSSTGVVTGSPVPGSLNPMLPVTTSPANEDADDSIIGILPVAEEFSTTRIIVSATQNSVESGDRDYSNDLTRRTSGGVASADFDATFSQSDTNVDYSSLNTERETLYKQLAGRVDKQSDAVIEQLEKNNEFKGRVVGSVGVVTTGFSVGYLFWAVRLGTLASGLLAQVPAWSMLDPLLVIDGDQKEDEDDKESLQNIMDRQQAKVNKTQEPPEIEPAVNP